MKSEDLRVAVVSSESRPLSNRLWYATRELVGDLLVVGPDDGSQVPQGQLVLPTVGRRKLTFWHHRGLGAVLDGFGADLVHVNNEPWGVTALEQLRRPEPWVLLSAENLFHDQGLVPQVRMRLADRVIDSVSGYASWNQAGVDHALARRGAGLPSLVMPAIIPPPEFVPASWVGPSDDRVHVLLIGRLEGEKGFDKVIEAVGRLDDRQRYLLHVAGTGPQEAELKALAARLGVEAVFHGFVGSHEVAQLMTTVSCLVQPSQTVANWAEQFGRTVAEAMTVGVPCLVSDSGELPNVVNDPQCVFPEADVAVLAERLSWLCASPERLREMGARAQRESGRWSPERAAREVVDFWLASLDYSRSSSARRG